MQTKSSLLLVKIVVETSDTFDPIMKSLVLSERAAGGAGKGYFGGPCRRSDRRSQGERAACENVNAHAYDRPPVGGPSTLVPARSYEHFSSLTRARKRAHAHTAPPPLSALPFPHTQSHTHTTHTQHTHNHTHTHTHTQSQSHTHTHTHTLRRSPLMRGRWPTRRARSVNC